MNHTDNSTNIQDLRNLIQQFVSERQWESYHTPKSLAIALSIEVAELLEHFLFKPNETISPSDSNYNDFLYEMADIFIYLLNLANTLKLESFSDIIFQKIQVNHQKYPKELFTGKNYKKQG